MRAVRWSLSLLLVGCATAPTPGSFAYVDGIAGPTAVTTTLPVAPTPTPGASPTLPPCGAGTACYRLFGEVFDKSGLPVTEKFTVQVASAASPGTVVGTGEGSNGAYQVFVPGSIGSVLLTVQGDGFAARQRIAGGERSYGIWAADALPRGPVYRVLQATAAASPSPGSEMDFGGPASAADPDAPAFYLPRPPESGAVVAATPVLPFEDAQVSTFGVDSVAKSNSSPRGLAVSASGQVAVAQYDGNSVDVFTPQGAASLLAGGADFAQSEDTYLVDGKGPAAHFYEPSDVAFDAAGNLFVADTANSAIRKVTPDGTVTTVAGSRTYGQVDGTGARAQFFGPTGLVVDSHQNILVADAQNNCIRKVTPAGVVTTLAGSTVAGYANGVGMQARFRAPARLAIDKSDTLFVVDDGNHRIRRVTPAGQVSDAFGAIANQADGSVVMPALASFQDVAVDAAGFLYVATNNRVYKISPAGAVTILAGYGLWGQADGTSRTAYFESFGGIALDAAGSVYVTEVETNRIRKIVPAQAGKQP